VGVKRPGILATLVGVPAGRVLSELTDSTTSITDTDASSYRFIGGSGGDAYGELAVGKDPMAMGKANGISARIEE
jgi:hypothetical protein